MDGSGWCDAIRRRWAYVMAFAGLAVVSGGVLYWAARGEHKSGPATEDQATSSRKAESPSARTTLAPSGERKWPVEPGVRDVQPAHSPANLREDSRVGPPSPSGETRLNLEAISRIPGRKDSQELGSKGIVAVRIIESSTSQVVTAFREKLALPVNVEVSPGQQRRVSIIADNVTAASLLAQYTEAHGDLVAVKNDARGGMSVLWKDSPLKRASAVEYTAKDVPRGDALQMMVQAVQRSLGPNYRVIIGGMAGNISPTVFSDKISLSLTGTPYQALDALASTGTRMCWSIRWRDDHTAEVTIREIRRQPPANPSLSIIGEP